MIYPMYSKSAGASAKEIHYGRHAVRNVYRNVDGVIKCVYSSNLIYFGRRDDMTRQNLPVVRDWANIVAQSHIQQTSITVPGTGTYLHIYIPTSYANAIRLYINGILVNPTRIASTTFNYLQPDEMARRVMYYCYVLPYFNTSDSTIMVSAEPSNESNPLSTLMTADKTSYVGAINELYQLIQNIK